VVASVISFALGDCVWAKRCKLRSVCHGAELSVDICMWAVTERMNIFRHETAPLGQRSA
jgi:hypothetical protein